MEAPVTAEVHSLDPGSRPFMVSQVERELRELWREASVEANTQGAVLRACVHNLIVWNEDPSTPLSPLLSEISRTDPGRIFLLEVDATLPEGMLTSEVTAVCHLRAGGGHICGEQIRLRAHPDVARLLPSAVQSLLIGDLPIFLWSATPIPQRPDVFERLARLADRVILGIASFAHDRPLLEALDFEAALLAHARDVVELAWLKTAHWRETLADVFEPLERRRQLRALRKLEICMGTSPSPSLEGLLLAGWLVARLDWMGEAPPPESWTTAVNDPSANRLTRVWSFELSGRNGVLRLSAHAPSDSSTGDQLTLESADGWGVVLEDTDAHLRVRLLQDDHLPTPAAAALSSPELPQLISYAIQSSGRESQFGEALKAARQLLYGLEELEEV
jgi:glucose-6-phosphate dehydrogenase assembly protein OpcA